MQAEAGQPLALPADHRRAGGAAEGGGLVAEDDATNRKVILRQLSMLGYAADVAADGEEALRMWQAKRYALLLSDLHMPALDGYGLTRAIRAREPAGTHVPILALTANALREEVERARSMGMDDYLTKPVPLETLRQTLARYLPA